MVFDAHERAFRLFGGMCRRGIYDNMATAVEAVFVGKDRRFNRRFPGDVLALPGRADRLHPGGGLGERGGVENQVGNAREHLFTPRLLPTTPSSTPGWRRAACPAPRRARARIPSKPTGPCGALQAEQASRSIAYCGPFDGFREIPGRGVEETAWCALTTTATTSLRSRRTHTAARLRRASSAATARSSANTAAADYAHGQTAYDPWHYLPVLARKPGALRNGDPFRNWDLPPALAQIAPAARRSQ